MECVKTQFLSIAPIPGLMLVQFPIQNFVCPSFILTTLCGSVWFEDSPQVRGTQNL